MSVEEVAAAALDEAQTEQAQAVIGLVEATARAETAQEAVNRLKAAVAALNGETVVGPTAPLPSPPSYETQGVNAQRPDRVAMHEMTAEEFDKERKRKQRARQKEEIANNPLGHLKCPGCGTAGHMSDSVIQTEAGGVIRMLVCGECGNQQMAG